MKYVLTGSMGHITRPIAIELIKAGHDVSIITSSQSRVSDIEAIGAKAVVGSVEDTAFLYGAFAGADAVYTMVPPKWDAVDWKEYIGGIGANYAEAIKNAGVKKVVNLSSIGAHLPEGCGPVTGLYKVEQALNSLDADVVHLRPSYFYDNLFANIGMIKSMNIMGSNFKSDSFLPFADTSDIAAVAASILLNPTFLGKSVHYIVSDVTTPATITSAIGAALGNPDLPWVEFSDEQSIGGMQQAGLSKEVASNYTEMGGAIRSGKMFEDFVANGKPVTGQVKVDDFAKRFASVYSAS